MKNKIKIKNSGERALFLIFLLLLISRYVGANDLLHSHLC
jgi:hypothetical protein